MGPSPRVDRYSETYCALMCDIDFFKQYNDSVGHLGGDMVLRDVAAALRGACREGDQVYRFGGEEFLIILYHCEIEGALERAEHFRAIVEQLAIPHLASPLGKVTISIGVSCLAPGGHPSTQAWLINADNALYEAKDRGRNRVEAEATVRA